VMNLIMGLPQFAEQKESFQALFGPKCCDGMKQPNNMCTSGTLKPDAIANYDCNKKDGSFIDNIDDQAACTAAGGTSYTPITCSVMNLIMGLPQFAEQKESFQALFGPKCCDGMKQPNGK